VAEFNPFQKKGDASSTKYKNDLYDKIPWH
jgi:hypothetical protein